MAATETIRIVLHAQARPGLCFPCTLQPSYRSERSPPKVGVVAFCGRNPCHGSLSCNSFRGSRMCTTALILLSICKLRPLLDDVPTTSEVLHRLYVAAAQYLTL